MLGPKFNTIIRGRPFSFMDNPTTTKHGITVTVFLSSPLVLNLVLPVDKV